MVYPSSPGTLKGTVSVDKAIARGLLWVNGPVLTLLLGPLMLMAWGNQTGVIPRSQNWLIAVVFPAGFVLAWGWWSITVPKWRLWAYERVTDIGRLKRRAVTAGITWPDGSVFSKTEWKSREHALRERELDNTLMDRGTDAL